MAAQEIFTGIGEPEQLSGEMIISGVKFEFKNFNPGVLNLDLKSQELDDLKLFLTINDEHKPQEVTVIFDGEQPRLALVSGMRERWSNKGPLGFGKKDKYLGDIPYLYLIKTDPEDKNVFVQGSRDFYEFENRGGRGLDVDYYFPQTYRKGGTVTITKNNSDLVISAESGERTHPGRNN